MDIFAKNTFLLRVIALLVLLNVVTISYVLYTQYRLGDAQNPPPKPPISQITQLLKDELQLSKAQETQLSALREDFFRKEEVLSNLIKMERDSMNEQMFNGNTDSTSLIHIAQRVAANEYQMELYRIEQAHQLKKICTVEQLQKLHQLVREIRDYFQPRKK